VQTFVSMNISVCIGSGCFYVYYVCIHTNKSILVYINPLSRIHNASLISTYFGLDSRECKCLEYLFIYCINVAKPQCIADKRMKISLKVTAH
jgi:hypothetical protein